MDKKFVIERVIIGLDHVSFIMADYGENAFLGHRQYQSNIEVSHSSNDTFMIEKPEYVSYCRLVLVCLCIKSYLIVFVCFFYKILYVPK